MSQRVMTECYIGSSRNVTVYHYEMIQRAAIISHGNIVAFHKTRNNLKDPNPPAPDGPGSIPSTEPQRVHQIPDAQSPRRLALQAGSVPDFQPPSLGERDRLRRRCWSPQTRRS